MGNRFVRCDMLSRSSTAFANAIDDIIAEMDIDERTELIEDIFQILTASGAVYLSDLTENKMRQAIEITHQFRKEKTVHRFALQLAEKMFLEFRTTRQFIQTP